MPLLTQEKAIKEYYESIKGKFPNLSFDEVQGICKAPGNFIKEVIRGVHLATVMVKHLGKFRVFRSRLIKQVKKEEIFFKKGITTEQEYTERVTRYKNHIKLLEDEYEKDDEGDECE